MKKKIAFKNGGKIRMIDPDTIIYIKCVERKCLLVLDNETYTYNSLAKNLIEILPVEFVRTQKSYIANLNRIEYMTRYNMCFDNGKIIPIGKTYIKDIYAKLNIGNVISNVIE